ncbi:hypothetical protein AGABI1DRAFT_101971 [Agaricus bisporus var. burnettii JB137-S8]|uniref:Uncharacterized protein n=1 Tax=Agaricus bisporus var. burnettii (strain JB137-S8 / ATCC MYA-4627 / FGSC 10392) TaxID=597362 RepID=K5X285_AGABU|nr:uncharacterized protein AGABI1DRAFT_101971 [Agaricus bisporus var. burnettii JB137-S8]EKM77022.1 hypothetical protein AGABI1DRAFT_101971 [Agaricus bisporus var. burnettii JB137-S8]
MVARLVELTPLPCTSTGALLPENAAPSTLTKAAVDNWAPFKNCAEFQLADLLFRRVEMSIDNINELCAIHDGLLQNHGDVGPFASANNMYETINSIQHGDAPWLHLKASLSLNVDENTPTWKKKEYDIWYRDPDVVLKQMLNNPDFDGEFDYTPYIELDTKGEQQWSDVMSGNYAWRQANRIYDDDPSTAGSMYCPIICGTDKTTVSVATGHVEYHPGYISIGNLHNNVRRAHRNGVVPFIFFPIPKNERKDDKDNEFRTFKKQLFHMALSAVFRSIRPAMLTPVIRRCPDSHYRRVIYDFTAFIGDYPEQVVLAGIVQGWCAKCTALPDNLDASPPALPRERSHTDFLSHLFHEDAGQLWNEYGIDNKIVMSPFTSDYPRADIYAMLSPDLLHQVIKGTFKDHLVTWVGEYLEIREGKARAATIMDDIDRRIAAAPAFPGLRRFPEGRRFKQWTGDDSKALMKVLKTLQRFCPSLYIPALVGYIPSEMIRTLVAFLEFCYIARRPRFSLCLLDQLNHALHSFHLYREVFQDTGVHPKGISLPRQHSLMHYRTLIEEFGAPGGLCSSITESRHITAVKKPWRRSNRYNALGQMLQTNQRLDKLHVLRVDFVARKMIPPFYEMVVKDNMDNELEAGPVDELVSGNVVLARSPAAGYPRNIDSIAEHIQIANFSILTRRFLYDQLDPLALFPAESVPHNRLPEILSDIAIYHSAVATFYAPSDPSGLHGIYRLRCTPQWRHSGPRRDCAFVVEDQGKAGFGGLSVVRLHLLFSFKHSGTFYPCALVQWFNKVGTHCDADTGLWMVEPDLRVGPTRGAHLMPIFGRRLMPENFRFEWSLDSFQGFYVNQYIDHHTHELLSSPL